MVQRKVTRMIFKRCKLSNLKFPPSYNERCKKLNIETLYFRRKITDLTFFHFIHQNPYVILSKNRPTLSRPRYRLRHNKLYDHPQVRTNLRRNSFFVRATKEFNNIPPNLQNIECNKTFRKEIAKHLNKMRLYYL